MEPSDDTWPPVPQADSLRIPLIPARSRGDFVSLPYVPAINHSQSLLVSDVSTAFTSANHRNSCGASSTQFPHVLPKKKKKEAGLNKSHNLMGRVKPRAQIPPLAFDLLLVFKDLLGYEAVPMKGLESDSCKPHAACQTQHRVQEPMRRTLLIFIATHRIFPLCLFSQLLLSVHV